MDKYLWIIAGIGTFVSTIFKPKKTIKMTLTSTYEIGQEVTDPKTGKIGNITAARIVYDITVPEHIVPAETLLEVVLPE